MSQRAPGSALLHPLAVASLLALVLNDHVLKRAMPGFITGKLSDFAGMLLTPVFLHAVFEVVAARLGRRVSVDLSNRMLGLAALATALGFSLVELVPFFENAYCVGLGALQWPFRAAFSSAVGEPWPALGAVSATADATDLLAVPVALVAYHVGQRGAVVRSSGALRSVVSWLALLASLGWSPAAFAEDKPGAFLRDGFYLGGDLGAGVAFIDSSASISNGFRQSIDSSAFGRAVPAVALDLGGTVQRAHLVLGGRIAWTAIVEPEVDTLGQSFTVHDSRLGYFTVQLFGHYYPDLKEGLYFGAALGAAALEYQHADSETQRGYSLSLEGGYRAFMSPNLGLGGVVRVSGALLEGDDFGDTTLISPTLGASLAWH